MRPLFTTGAGQIPPHMQHSSSFRENTQEMDSLYLGKYGLRLFRRKLQDPNVSIGHSMAINRNSARVFKNYINSEVGMCSGQRTQQYGPDLAFRKSAIILVGFTVPKFEPSLIFQCDRGLHSQLH